MKIEGKHVHAHEDHPWNEMVDSIAGAVADGWHPPTKACLRSQNLLDHPLKEWAWMQIHPDAELPALESILVNSPPTKDKGCIDSTLKNSPLDRPRHQWYTTLRIATANVGTLDQQNVDIRTGVSYKTNEILHQMIQRNIHILAVQEGRARVSRHIPMGPVDCIVAAGEKGQAGVELWFHTDALSKICGGTVQFQSDICVWKSTPRILAVSCQLGGIHVDIIVGYAPQAGRPQVEISQWWQDLDAVLTQISPTATLLVMGDFNCKIGSVTSDGIGDLDAAFEDVGGECFRNLCTKYGLLVPSTWSEFHHGPSDTFFGPRGSASRLDYIAVDHRCQSGIQQTYIDMEMDLFNGDRDHHPLVLDMALQFTKGRHVGFAKRPLYDRHFAKEHKGLPGCDLLSHMPIQEWHLDVNEHWSHLRDFMQQEAARWFPKAKRQRRQLYFNEDTWGLVCTRKDLRQQQRQLQRDFERALLGFYFVSWRNQHEEVEPGWPRIRSLIWQQEAVTLEARQNVDRLFRSAKKKAWKAWVDRQLADKMERAHESRGVDLFKVLKPKQMVQKKKGNLIKPLPGLQDADGVWQKSAREIAVAWQKQFGAIEHAEEVTFDQLLARSEPSCQPIEVEQLGQVPTLYDVEAAIRTLNCDKAPGLDNLGTELFQLDVSHAAQRLFALHLKTALRKQNVPELTGGWLLPLHKKKGSPAHMPAYRAIMLEPTVARMLSRAWRPKLTEGITKVAQPLQYGGRRGLGIEALHLQVRLWQSTARHEKLSLGLVFIDIQAAFYSVIKPMLATVKDTTDSLSQVFSKLNLPSSAYQEFLQSVGSGQLIYEAIQPFVRRHGSHIESHLVRGAPRHAGVGTSYGFASRRPKR